MRQPDGLITITAIILVTTDYIYSYYNYSEFCITENNEVLKEFYHEIVLVLHYASNNLKNHHRLEKELMIKALENIS